MLNINFIFTIYNCSFNIVCFQWYDENGKPVPKRKKIQTIHEPLLEVTNIWQRIIDDKWVIGVDLKNNSER